MARGDREAIARSYYFNSWMRGGDSLADRLLALLTKVDGGIAEDPRFDRSLDFATPDERGLFRFERRSSYDRDVMARTFADLPRDYFEPIFR